MKELQGPVLIWLNKARVDLGLSPLKMTPEEVTPDFHPLTGCQLENKVIGKLLGVGSFAVVFELDGSSPSGGRLAVKVMPRTVGEEAAKDKELFLREIQIGQRLRHPTITPLHSFTELAQSRFVILERIEGETLAAVIGRKMPVTRYRELFTQFTEGLAYAHKHEVVHRDLKPENVMLSPDGSLKILDFGMARLNGSTTVTITGQFKGTPMYCAPEQIIDSKTVGEACDQFSFGLLSYQILTGQFPYNLVPNQPMQTLFARLQQQAAKLSAVWPEVGQAADDAMARMLAMKPEDRFPTIEEAFETFSQALPG